MRCALLPSLLLLANGALAQAPQKGRIEVLWGWNRDAYSASDIRFTGEGYDFTLHGVRASDRPSDISIEYLSPTKLTLPQTNLRINYSLTEHWAVGIAFDHMKYVMAQGQQVGISGTLPEIDAQRAQGGSITLDREFLTYEHTDGLNFVNARIERRDRLARLNAIRLDVASATGLSVGALVPRTACRFHGKELSDDYHLSGAGLGLHAGARLTFLGCIVIAAEAHGAGFGCPMCAPPTRPATAHRNPSGSSRARCWWAPRSASMDRAMARERSPRFAPVERMTDRLGPRFRNRMNLR
ncbi:MAG: hypothetical protein IPK70_13905 [Flavobacteriales bacterium]|nr:hypothetical protein [Flavobacteriales bacterium]